MKRFISIITSLALLLALPSGMADARALHGGVASTGGGSTLITTLTIQNTSGSTQATNFVTQTFGHPFKKGDIANGCTGGAPKFELTGGTNVPFSEGLAPICWTDGSLKWAPFMLRVPTSIAGSGSLTINVKSGGTTPSASSRTLSDAASGSTDLNIPVTGLTTSLLSGTWVSNLNQGVSAAHADDYTYMDGDAGKVVRVRASFRQSSADHGQLEAYWYIQLLNNSSGAFGGMRALARITQPWYNIDTPTKNYRDFSAIALKNGASTIRDIMGSRYGATAAKNFTWTSGDTFQSTAYGVETSFEVVLSTNGSLPTGLSTSTNYFLGTFGANDFHLTVSPGAAVQNTGNITPTSVCTGTCTMTPYPYLTMFGSIYTAGANGQYDYIQAGGSVAVDSTTRIAFNNVYWRSTKMVPPYLLSTVTPSNRTATDYYPLSAGPMGRNTGATGERVDIGLEPAWAVTHFFNQDAADEQSVRVAALVGGTFPVHLRNKTTLTIPVLNNRTYTGMPTGDTTFFWKGSTNTTGFTPPSDTNVQIAGFNFLTFDHMPELEYYALLITGEPQNNDMMVDWGSTTIMAHKGTDTGTSVVNSVTNSMGGISNNGGTERNPTVNGVTYYGIDLAGTSGQRTTAWTARTQGMARAIGGGYGPAAAKTREYFADIDNDTYAAYLRYIAMLPTFAQNNGFWGEFDNNAEGNFASWMTGYHLQAVSHDAAINENADALTFASHLAKEYKFLHDNFGTWTMPFYYGIIRTGNSFTPSGNGGSNPYLTSASGFGVGGGQGSFSLSWTSGSPTITVSSGTNYAPANGDFVTPNVGTNPAALATSPSASPWTTYCMKNASGMTFEVSALPCGGTSITMTDTGTSSNPAIGAVGHPSTNNIAAGGAGSGYTSNISGSLNMATAAGATVDATTRTDINANLATVPNYITEWNNDPRYAFGTIY